MSLSTRVLNTLIDKINTSFQNIGANGTRPKMSNNLEPIAWELWVANHLASYANKRKLQAEDAAVKAGVIFDKEKNPQPPGTDMVIFSGDVISVSVQVRKPTTRVDDAKMYQFLHIRGVKQSLLDEAVEFATKENRPAHVFNAKLIHKP